MAAQPGDVVLWFADDRRILGTTLKPEGQIFPGLVVRQTDERVPNFFDIVVFTDWGQIFVPNSPEVLPHSEIPNCFWKAGA